MNYPIIPYRIFPLGDAAITVDFGNRIDEELNDEVMNRYRQLKEEPLSGITEIIPAYCSLTVYYTPVKIRNQHPGALTAYDLMKQWLEEKLREQVVSTPQNNRLIKIPVCYNAPFNQDIFFVTATNAVSQEEIISLHTSLVYRVFMLGFLPGFAYMGQVDERIAVPRKQQPVPIAAGSVGIAGRQTGIYPLASPGGWQIIGRTPLELFDAANDNPVLLQAGDTVQFYSISNKEFEEMQHSGFSEKGLTR